MSLNSFNFFDHFLNDYLFSDNFDFFYLGNDIVDLFDDLNLFRDFFYSLSNLRNIHNFLYYPIYYLILGLNVVFDFSSIAILHYLHNLLDYLLDLDNLWDFYDLFNYPFLVYRHLYYFFNDLFDWYKLLDKHLDPLYLSLDVIDDSFYLYRYFNLNYLFLDKLDLHNFVYYLFKLNQLLYYSRDLDDGLYLSLVRD